MRIAALQRRVEADPEHYLVEPIVELVLAPDPVNFRRLTDDPAHSLARAEEGVGVLEDHLHPEGVVGVLAAAHPCHRAPAELDGSVRRLVDAGHRPAQGRLAAARFADEPTTSPVSIARSTPSTARTTSSRKFAPSLVAARATRSRGLTKCLDTPCRLSRVEVIARRPDGGRTPRDRRRRCAAPGHRRNDASPVGSVRGTGIRARRRSARASSRGSGQAPFPRRCDSESSRSDPACTDAPVHPAHRPGHSPVELLPIDTGIPKSACRESLADPGGKRSSLMSMARRS